MILIEQQTKISSELRELTFFIWGNEEFEGDVISVPEIDRMLQVTNV